MRNFWSCKHAKVKTLAVPVTELKKEINETDSNVFFLINALHYFMGFKVNVSQKPKLFRLPFVVSLKIFKFMLTNNCSQIGLLYLDYAITS